MRITLLLTLLLGHTLLQADTLTGHVVRVTDGDTIVILDSGNAQHKIRLQYVLKALQSDLDARAAFGFHPLIVTLRESYRISQVCMCTPILYLCVVIELIDSDQSQLRDYC